MRVQYLALAFALTSAVSAKIEYLDNEFESQPPSSSSAAPVAASSTTSYPVVDAVPAKTDSTTTSAPWPPTVVPSEFPSPTYTPSPAPIKTVPAKEYPSVEAVETLPSSSAAPVYVAPSVDPVQHPPSSAAPVYVAPSVAPVQHSTTSCTKGQSSVAPVEKPTSVPAYVAPKPPSVAPKPATTAVPEYEAPSKIPVEHETTTSCTKGQSSAVPKPATTPAPVYESPSAIPVGYTTTITEYDTEVVTKPCPACEDQTATQHVTKTITVPCSGIPKPETTPVYPIDQFSTIPAPVTYTTLTSTRTHTYYSTVVIPKATSTPVYPLEIPTYSSTITLQTTITLHTQTGTKTQTITYQTPATVPVCPGGYGCPSTFSTTKTSVPVYTPVYQPPAGNTTVPAPPATYTGAAGKVEVTGIFVASAIMAIAALMNL